MIVKFSNLGGPEFKRAINQLFHGHLVAYSDICRLQIRRHKTLVVSCVSRYSKSDPTQELGWITAVQADIAQISEDFRNRVDTLSWFAIVLVDSLDRRQGICTMYATSFDELLRFECEVKWPPTPEEIEAQNALREQEAKTLASKDRMHTILALGMLVLVLSFVGATPYFPARYSGLETDVTVLYALFTAGSLSAGATFVEFLIEIGLFTVPVYFFFTRLSQTELIEFGIDTAINSDQFLLPMLIGLAIGYLIRSIGKLFFD